MQIVVFKKSWRGYNSGEVAGFDSESAQELIKKGVAVPHASPPKTAGKQAREAQLPIEERQGTGKEK